MRTLPLTYKIKRATKGLHGNVYKFPKKDTVLNQFGFNGQLKDNEIYGEGNAYTAEFWEYDPRSIRRWNVDPKPNISLSPYNCFAGNPIAFSDIKGDTLKGGSVAEAQKMLEDVKSIFGETHEIFNEHLTLNSEGTTFNRINVNKFNKFINSKEAGLSPEQIALANGLMKTINSRYAVTVTYNNDLRSTTFATGKKSITSNISNMEKAFYDTQGLSREFTRAQIFVHEVLGEAYTFLSSSYNDALLYDQVTTDAMAAMRGNRYFNPNSTATPSQLKLMRSRNLFILQVENLYNRLHGFNRSGVEDHGVHPEDKDKQNSFPKPFLSSYYD